jgi:hypothetical protein
MIVMYFLVRFKLSLHEEVSMAKDEIDRQAQEAYTKLNKSAKEIRDNPKKAFTAEDKANAQLLLERLKKKRPRDPELKQLSILVVTPDSVRLVLNGAFSYLGMHHMHTD